MNELAEQREKLPTDLRTVVNKMDMAVWAWHQLGDEHRENARTACTAVLSNLGTKDEHGWLAKTVHARLVMLHGKHPSSSNIAAFAKWLLVEERTRNSLWWRFWYC